MMSFISHSVFISAFYTVAVCICMVMCDYDDWAYVAVSFS